MRSIGRHQCSGDFLHEYHLPSSYPIGDADLATPAGASSLGPRTPSTPRLPSCSAPMVEPLNSASREHLGGGDRAGPRALNRKRFGAIEFPHRCFMRPYLILRITWRKTKMRFKSLKRSRFVLVGLLASLLTCASLAAPPNKSIRSGPQHQEATVNTLPTSQQQLWERLLRLLKEDDAFTPRDRVEAVLGFKFSKAGYETNPPTLGGAAEYEFEVETEGLGKFKVYLLDDPNGTTLFVRWGQPVLGGSHCLDFDRTGDDLRALGWIDPGPRSLNPGIGQLVFFRPSEIANDAAWEAARKKSYPEVFSTLVLFTPNQYSSCVNEFGARVHRKFPY